MSTTVVIASHSILSLAAVYLLIRNKTRYLTYSTVLVLTLCSVVGSFLRTLKMPGGDELLILGMAGTVLASALLIWKSFQNRQNQLILNKLFAALIMLVQIGSFYLAPAHIDKVGLLNYPLAAFIGTLLINKQYEHDGERSILILFLLQAILYIVLEILKLM